MAPAASGTLLFFSVSSSLPFSDGFCCCRLFSMKDCGNSEGEGFLLSSAPSELFARGKLVANVVGVLAEGVKDAEEETEAREFVIIKAEAVVLVVVTWKEEACGLVVPPVLVEYSHVTGIYEVGCCCRVISCCSVLPLGCGYTGTPDLSVAALL
jgi:hypothetical protein